jgi:hypothetical protein
MRHGSGGGGLLSDDIDKKGDRIWDLGETRSMNLPVFLVRLVWSSIPDRTMNRVLKKGKT